MLGTLDIEEAAKKAAGNWKDFNCFVWFRDREVHDADRWAILYTHHRDSGLLDLSNAAVIEKSLRPFGDGDDPDLVFESHHHWPLATSMASVFGFFATAKSPTPSAPTTNSPSEWTNTQSWMKAITRRRNSKQHSTT